MAISYVIDPNSRRDNGQTVVDVTLDSSYPANGYPLSNAGLGMLLKPDSIVTNTRSVQGVIGMWDETNHKLKMMKGAAGLLVECAAGDISSANVITLTCTGAPIL